MATQEESAARTGWKGPRGERYADLPGGWQIRHLSGKGAADRAVAACQPKRIVVIADKTDLPGAPPCLLFDLTRLRETGALAIDIRNDALRIRSVME